jgi:hypothetical protein
MERRVHNDTVVYYITDKNYKFLTAISFGKILIFNRKYETHETIMHEYGHQLQFAKLGPLFYLFVIGIPSLVGNLLFRIKWVRKHFDYYSLLWEANADKLGGVERK